MNCNRCGTLGQYVEQHGQYWCNRCRQYIGAPPGAGAQTKGTSLWLTVGLPVGIVLLLIVVGVVWMAMSATKSYTTYIKKGKSSEVRENLNAIAKGAEAYFQAEHHAPASMVPITQQLPGPSVGPTPSPLSACCDNGGKCEPEAMQWQVPTWEALYFSVEKSHYYVYSYEVAPDGQSYTAMANGDLDCDGVFSTYVVTGTVENGQLVTSTLTSIRANE